MKKLLPLLCIFLALNLSIFAQKNQNRISIVPQPNSIKFSSGDFTFNRKTKIVAGSDDARRLANFFNDYLFKNYNFKLEIVSQAPKKNAVIFDNQKSLASASPEAYNLSVRRDNVTLSGKSAGEFYALQTLMQILPVEFKNKAKIPAVEIADEPRFAYRGMHLDVGRHFFSVEFVKKYIDLMAQYKFNFFHWHLTEDQGWRIEIKKYPRLTEIGSKRTESVKEKNLQPYVGDNVPVEGFYTQDEIRDVVKYAKERFITIIPEIELPGHSSAALAAYPNLGCKANYNYKVQTTWGIFKEVYCPKEETFQFLEDVLSEVIDLFPDSPYIHIGGDEVLQDFWKDSPEVQQFKTRENLKDEHEVQSYFIRRMEKFINSKGKKIIGWDEILEGGLAPNATVMSWRGEKGGIEAAKSHHDVIMTPTDYVYFDYGQGDPIYEPINIGNYLNLEKVYSYNPQSKELAEDEKKFVLGAQANVWTEYMQTPEKVEYMVFPRMLALSEVVWTMPENKNFADFQKRLQNQYSRLDRQNVNYRIPEPVGLHNIVLSDSDRTKIELALPIAGGKIFYTSDGSEPTEKSKLYKKPFELTLKPNEKVDLKTIVITPSGRKSVIYAATVLRREPLKSIELNDKKAGVNLQFYKSDFQSVKDFDANQPTETLETKSVMLPQFAKKTNDFKEPFAANFDGYIYAPQEAIYEFQIETTGGAILKIGGETVINLDNTHSKQTQNGLVPLTKGFHKLNLKYFQSGGNAVLNFRRGIKGQGLGRIYGNELWH